MWQHAWTDGDPGVRLSLWHGRDDGGRSPWPVRHRVLTASQPHNPRRPRRKPAGVSPLARRYHRRMSELKIALVHAGERAELAVTTGTKAWELFKDDAGRDRGPGGRRAEGPRLRAAGRRRGRGRRDRQPRRPRHPAALDRARDGPGGAGPVPGRPARHRPADRERLLLRLRRRDPVRARGPREDRDPDAQDHQGGPAVLPPGHHRRRRARRAQGRALQDRADRAQGRRGLDRLDHREPSRARASRSAPASSPSTTTSAATARSRGATCAAARTCRPPSGSRRSS